LVYNQPMSSEQLKYFDVHGHPNFPAYDADREAVVGRAFEAGVWMTAVGTTLPTSKAAVALAEKYEEGLYAIVGIHPTHASPSHADPDEIGDLAKVGVDVEAEVFDEKVLNELAANKKTVAIGECGLDYFRMEKSSKALQKELFIKHIQLANKAGKPLMLHVRNGKDRGSVYIEAAKILKEYARVPFDFHFFAGSLEETKLLLDLGAHFSFTGVVTFARSYDEVIKYLPLDRIMSETDCPYIAPVPHRGKRNEPAYVREVVRSIAEIRGGNPRDVEKSLATNALAFFGII